MVLQYLNHLMDFDDPVHKIGQQNLSQTKTNILSLETWTEPEYLSDKFTEFNMRKFSMHFALQWAISLTVL